MINTGNLSEKDIDKRVYFFNGLDRPVVGKLISWSNKSIYVQYEFSTKPVATAPKFLFFTDDKVSTR